MRDQVIFSAEGRINTKKERARDCKNSSVVVNVPVSYKSNTAREDLCLEYVQSFLRQYEKLYPMRKLPYILVDNEQGLQKFICSFIRPTQIALSELYDMYECSAFLAGYILYEPLDPVTKPPQIIFSPTETLKRHTGDCFDISTLLCSLLIGCGYDAYVVCGYAPRHITLRDQSSTLFPMSNNQNDTIVKTKLKSEEEGDSLYIPIDDSVKTSEFVAHQEERKRLEMLDKFELWIEDLPPPPTTAQQEIIDDSICGERRLHAWVMILAGQRDLKENYFFESSTGRAYSTTGSPYTVIDSVWNANNFWVLNKSDTKIADVRQHFN
jgi:hypothetical protein